MGNQYVGNAATFLIETVFGLYILIVMLRFLLQWVRADFYNPLSQFMVKVTQPALGPLRRFIPGYAGIDLAAVVLLFALKLVELFLLSAVLGYRSSLAGLLLMSAAALLKLLIQVFVFSILIQVVISWINPGLHNPVTSLMHTLNEPLLRPARRLLPPTGGMDLSPLIVLVVLQLSLMLLVAPILDVARRML